MNIWKNRKLLILLLLWSLILSLTACGEKQPQIDPQELFQQSIEEMRNLTSYVVNAEVIISSAEPTDDDGNMKATITYHREPFSYSNLQEISTVGANSTSPLDTIQLYLFAKESTLYMFNSVVGMWVNNTDPTIVKQVEETADIFGSFSAEDFTNLKVMSIEKGKATLQGITKNSNFLHNLMEGFESTVTGSIEAVIDTSTKHMESFIYSPTFETSGGLVHHTITIRTRDFNKAPEVVLPQEALE